jgi:small GTP-binding protein
MKKKICMVGHFGVGKTSLVRRFVESNYDERYIASIGVKVDRKDVVAESKPVILMLWDMEGQDDLERFRLSNLRGASGYILVVDGCRATSLAIAVDLQQRIADQFGPLPFVLALNKADLRDRWEVEDAAISKLGWATFETSAKAGSGVEEMFLALAAKMLQ